MNDKKIMTVVDALENHRGSYIAGEVGVAVVGAGHAGVEAALASARLGVITLITTLTLDSLANLPCNPSIGGTAKGQLVREIDALGGEMGKAADRQMIQFRMLNRSKGPAVLSPRSQIDRVAYQRDIKQVIESEPLLTLVQGEVIALLGESQPTSQPVVKGILLITGAIWLAEQVVITTGTYLNSRVIIGEAIYASGPDGLAASGALSQSLASLNLSLRRFKTGTPARIRGRSLDFSLMTKQPGDSIVRPFSYQNDCASWTSKAERPCWLTWTTDETKTVISDNLHRSPLYSGEIKGIGPRYCPSIEDKIVRFPEHLRHHVFVEPTGLDTDEFYASGLSSSLPEDVQMALLCTIPGFASIEVSRIGYAIEYDCIDPTALKQTLATKHIDGLFLAGQINGSSGYEEAAGQGLIAGINAAHRVLGKAPVVIGRDQGYLGVLIDDLVTKGTDEPYRLMTSRAEYRLLLRQDNADERLTPLGYEIGLISQKRWKDYEHKQESIAAEINRCRKQRLGDLNSLNHKLGELGTSLVKQPPLICEMLKRPQVTYADLADSDGNRPVLPTVVQEAVEVNLKYEGYIEVEQNRLVRFHALEKQIIPNDFNYLEVSGLRLEAQQKLNQDRPTSLGQAARMPGVTPADIQVLQILISTSARNSSSDTPSNSLSRDTDGELN